MSLRKPSVKYTHLFLHISRNISAPVPGSTDHCWNLPWKSNCSYTYLGIFQHLYQAKDVIAETFHASNVLYICSYIHLGIFQHLSQAKDVLCGNLPCITCIVHFFLHISRNISAPVPISTGHCGNLLCITCTVLYISSYTYLGIFQHLSQAKDVLCGNLPFITCGVHFFLHISRNISALVPG